MFAFKILFPGNHSISLWVSVTFLFQLCKYIKKTCTYLVIYPRWKTNPVTLSIPTLFYSTWWHSHFSAFLLTIGFQGTCQYLDVFKIKRHVFIYLSRSPHFKNVVHFGIDDNCVCVLNEHMDSISQKSGPFQKPTWKFYSFYVYFVIFCSLWQ